jgi:hypothetical protein
LKKKVFGEARRLVEAIPKSTSNTPPTQCSGAVEAGIAHHDTNGADGNKRIW